MAERKHCKYCGGGMAGGFDALLRHEDNCFRNAEKRAQDCKHSAAYARNGKLRCALCDLAAANVLLRKSLQQIDRYREAMIEATNDLPNSDVGARLHLALHERPYQGHSIEAHLSYTSDTATEQKRG